MSFKSGFITIIGRPNVGKSTLLNQILGEKIAITTSKPQTTRNRITGVFNASDAQLVFLDTPGIHKPKHRLGEVMVETALTTCKEVDVILFMVDAADGIGKGDQYILDQIKGIKTPILLVLNKMDKVSPADVQALENSLPDRDHFEDVIGISATEGKNITFLMNRIMDYMTEGPMYYPAGMISDQPERAVIAEIIREKVLMYLEQEIPHGVAIEIEALEGREDKDIIDVSAVIITEKKSHKGIIIGKNGRKLKGIGKAAREDIEALLGSKVFLELWVKVKEGWRDSDVLLKNYGFRE